MASEVKKNLVKAGVIGWPVAHSLSPALNAFWREDYHIDGTYTRIPLPPEVDFDDAIRKLVVAGYVGLNVTLPYKAAAAELADEQSEQVGKLGVANMLTFKEGKVYADNSDVGGFKASLSSVLTPTDKKSHALVLGAGGAAPAICLALEELEFEKITVSNRTKQRADDLAAKFDHITRVLDWEDYPQTLTEYDLVVNTTSSGMEGQGSLIIDTALLQKNTIVADIVYAPLETDLLKSAKEKGLRTVNGLAMLMRQAVPGFQLWFGMTPDVTKGLEQHLSRILEKRRQSPVKIGLTGSIGMGKTTIGQILARLGADLWDADSAVHRLYAKGGGASGPLREIFPNAVEDGEVIREKLAAHLMETPQDFRRLEEIVHPLVDADRQAFMRHALEEGAEAIVLDIPLLFETRQQHRYDVVMVVTAPEEVRHERVMKRPGMTVEKYNAIVARQMPEEEKRLLADYLILTGKPLEETAKDVIQAYHDILEKYGSGLS